MPKAVILGARPNSGNIGEAIAAVLHTYEWEVIEDECRYGIPAGYAAPPLSNFVEWDADACVISLGRTYKEDVLAVREIDFFNVLYANLELPLRCALRYAQESGEGPDLEVSNDRPRHIVFIGSYAHRHPFTNGTAYCAAKAGLDMATRTLGWELTDRGFRVHIVHPYHVEGTPMWETVQAGVMESKNWTREEADAYARKDLKMPAPLKADDVGEVVGWLLTSPAAEWTSGTAIELSGGTR